MTPAEKLLSRFLACIDGFDNGKAISVRREALGMAQSMEQNAATCDAVAAHYSRRYREELNKEIAAFEAQVKKFPRAERRLWSTIRPVVLAKVNGHIRSHLENVREMSEAEKARHLQTSDDFAAMVGDIYGEPAP